MSLISRWNNTRPWLTPSTRSYNLYPHSLPALSSRTSHANLRAQQKRRHSEQHNSQCMRTGVYGCRSADYRSWRLFWVEAIAKTTESRRGTVLYICVVCSIAFLHVFQNQRGVPDETSDTQLAGMRPLLSTETAAANDRMPVYALTVNGDVHYHSNVGPPCPATYEVDEDNSSSLRLPYPQPALLLPPRLEAPATTHSTEHNDH